MIVQKLRLKRGWSQEDLAAVSGLSVRTIQRIERGQTASLDSRKALAAAFDVDLSDLKEPDMSGSQSASNAEEAVAFARVRRIKSFYLHAAQFALVMGAFVVVSYLYFRSHLWLIFVTVGWGSGVLLHGLKAFGNIPFMNAEWEKRQVEAFLGRKL